MAMDVGKAFGPAIEHTKQVLFRPFVLTKWMALGFVAMLAGGSGGSSISYRDFSGFDTGRPNPGDFGHTIEQWVSARIALIVLGAVFGIVLVLILSWLSSVMKLVYVDQVTRNHGAIKEPFSRLRERGTSFFLWGVGFGLAVLLALGILVGIPLAIVFIGHAGTAATVIAVIWAIIVGIAVIIVAGVGSVFADDFVVPTMYARNVRVLEAWRIVLPVLRANAGQSVLYLLLLFVIGLAGGIAGVIVALALLLVFALPGIVLGALGYAIWQFGGGWSPWLIGYVGLFGCALLLAYVYTATCALQPFTVFKRSYALVILGQGDAGLATVPIVVAPPMPPRPPDSTYGQAPPMG